MDPANRVAKFRDCHWRFFGSLLSPKKKSLIYREKMKKKKKKN